MIVSRKAEGVWEDTSNVGSRLSGPYSLQGDDFYTSYRVSDRFHRLYGIALYREIDYLSDLWYLNYKDLSKFKEAAVRW